jgi:hypothetical protein
MQCDIESEREEMTSAMLLQRPLFKAVRFETTITMHWKCLGPAAAHHYKQMLVTCSSHKFISTPSSTIHKRDLRISKSASMGHLQRSRASAVDEAGDDFEDADEVQQRPINNFNLDSNTNRAEFFDTYRRFRSSALAMTVRLSAAETHTVLHIKTIRWILDFMDAVEKEADPVRRYIGSIDEDRKRRKKLVPRSSLSLHTKAVQASTLV